MCPCKFNLVLGHTPCTMSCTSHTDSIELFCITLTLPLDNNLKTTIDPALAFCHGCRADTVCIDTPLHTAAFFAMLDLSWRLTDREAQGSCDTPLLLLQMKAARAMSGHVLPQAILQDAYVIKTQDSLPELVSLLLAYGACCLNMTCTMCTPKRQTSMITRTV